MVRNRRIFQVKTGILYQIFYKKILFLLKSTSDKKTILKWKNIALNIFGIKFLFVIWINVMNSKIDTLHLSKITCKQTSIFRWTKSFQNKCSFFIKNSVSGILKWNRHSLACVYLIVKCSNKTLGKVFTSWNVQNDVINTKF